MSTHLQAVDLDAALVINVHVLALRCCEEQLIVQEADIPYCLFDLQRATERRAKREAAVSLCRLVSLMFDTVIVALHKDLCIGTTHLQVFSEQHPMGLFENDCGRAASTCSSQMVRSWCQSSIARCPLRPPSTTRRPLRVKSSL